MKRKRVIFITGLTLWSMGKGHGGPAFTQTIKKYINEGWEVYLISDEPSNRDYPELDAAHNISLKPTFFKHLGQLRKIGLLFRWLDRRMITHAFCKTAKKIIGSDGECTVLYAYEVFGVAAAHYLSRKTGCPLVTRFQGTVLCMYADTLINRVRRYPHFGALRTKADCVIMTDDGTFGAKVLSDLGNTSPTLFLRNGLELMDRNISAMKVAFDSQAFRAAFGIAPEEPMFLTVSRLVSWKRVDRTIDGFSRFCGYGLPGKLVIVGGGDSQPSLEQRVKELEIADRVVFTGAVPHDAVYQYMMACDVFLSLYDISNVGNPLLEAMTLGKCIVTLDVGDTCSLIEHKKNAILLTAETLPTLGEILKELVENPSQRQRLGDAAATYAQNHFQTWDERMDTEFRVVSSLLDVKRSQ